MIDTQKTLGYGLLSVLVNVVLMLVKLITGILGHSFALVADGIESASDIFVSLITWTGFHLSLRPPDNSHPYGHGKIESLAGMFSGICLILAGVAIAVQSVREILHPHTGPAWFTLPVLLVIVAVKEGLSRKIFSLADESRSHALEGDAWHHRSDAVTSGATAIGISIALIGGERYAVADDWAALVACAIIFLNGGRIIARSLHENLDGYVGDGVIAELQQRSGEVPGVLAIEKCVARKSGIQYLVDLHVEVDGDTTVTEGHRIGHQVKDHLLEHMPNVADVVVHLEPYTPQRG